MRFVSIDSIYPTEATTDEQAIGKAREHFIDALEHDRSEPNGMVQHIVWLVEVEDMNESGDSEEPS